MGGRINRNDYVIGEQTVFIIIKYKKSQEFRCVVDKEDYAKVKDYTWGVAVKSDQYVRVRTVIWDPISARRVHIMLHRLILDVTDPEVFVDHINGDPLDNRKENLRLVSNAQNQQNRTRLSKANTSGITGISWNRRANCWYVSLKLDGKSIYIGNFINLEDAKLAVTTARAKYLPFSQEALTTPDQGAAIASV